MTVRFPCRGCGQQLLASSDLGGQELACAMCGEVTVVPGSGRTDPSRTYEPPAAIRRRERAAANEYRDSVHPVAVAIAALSSIPGLIMVSGQQGLDGPKLAAWAISELVTAGLAWSTWMRGGCWWANVLWTFFLSPLAGAIHAWASTSHTAYDADPNRRSLPVLIICTLLSVVAVVFTLILLAALVALIVVVLAIISGGGRGHH